MMRDVKGRKLPDPHPLSNQWFLVIHHELIVRGWTLSTLATKSGVSLTSIHNSWHAKRLMTVENLEALLNAVGYSLLPPKQLMNRITKLDRYAPKIKFKHRGGAHRYTEKYLAEDRRKKWEEENGINAMDGSLMR